MSDNAVDDDEAGGGRCTRCTRRVTLHGTRSAPRFTSDRERRLWLLVVVVVAAIYSTLGLAPMLAEVLRDRDLLDGSFGLGLLLVAATVVTLSLKTRPRGIEIGVALGVAAAYLLLVLRLALPVAERTHLIEYGVLAVFIHEALLERASQGRDVPIPALLAVLLTALIGVADEIIQGLIPGRVFDSVDIMFNVLAGAMAVAASVVLRRAQRWRRSSRS